ncbi:MAG: isochorismatase family protein [Hyphomicrobiaceae bacterium]
MRMMRQTSQLLIVDVQERLLPTIAEWQRVERTTVQLAHVARRLAVTTTVSEQYPRGLGGTSPVILEAAGNEAVRLDKVEFSCMANAGLRERLETLRGGGLRQIVVAGMEAHVCVAQTVLDLIAADFDVFVVADAVGSRSMESRRLALERMARQGAEIVDWEMAMFEWLERAGTPEFKELQGLLK